MKSVLIKLIVTDLDGTLLDDQKNIPPQNVFTLRKAMEKGVHVSIATGRNYYSAKRYIDELGLDVPVILQNGAFIYMPLENKVLYESLLELAIAKDLINYARKFELDYILYSYFLDEIDMYMDKEHNGGFVTYINQNSWRIKYVDDVLRYITSEKVAQVVLIGDESKIWYINDIIKQKYPGKYSVVKSTIVDGWSFIEFFGPGSSKEEAVAFLMNYFNVKSEETMFLGDGYNDLGVMKLVGFPVAVDNACDEVKEASRFVTLSNNEGGVAFAIEKFVL